MIFIYLLLFCLSLIGNTLGQITAAPSCSILADPWHSRVGLLVQKRAVSTYCDSNSRFYCFLPAACIYGHDGYIGCCTAIGTSCAPRTDCIDYASGLPAPCDYTTGGCVYCSDSNLPFCTTQYRDNKHVLGCGTKRLTTTYTNTDTRSAILALPSPAVRSSTPSAASTSASLPIQASSVDDPTASSSQPSEDLSSASSLPPYSISSSMSISTSTLPSPSEALPTPASNQPATSSSLASSRGLIIGVVVGAAAGSIILLSLAFILWKCWKRRRTAGGKSSKEKSNKAGYSLGSTSNEDTVTEHSNSRHDVAGGEVGSHGPAELEEQLRRATERKPGVEHAYSATPGLASSIHQQSGQPYSPEDIHGAAEAPANAPVWPSPNPTTMTSPTPSNSSLWMVSPVLGTPRAPSQYTAYMPFTPSSNYSNNGQPPSSFSQSRYGGRDAAQESPLAELEAHEVGRAQ